VIRRLGELWEATPLAFWLVLAACAYFLVMAARLTVIDVRHHLLPNRIVFPSYGVAGALLLIAAVTHSLSGGTASEPPSDSGAALFGIPGLRILAAAAVLWSFYFVLRLVYPPGMGFGDVKLAGVLGIYLGYLFGGLWSLGLIAARRGTLKSDIPFGPFMLAGTAAAMMLVPA
jgi:leader peptidase (prepilin peptidase)/N-methyltransferase